MCLTETIFEFHVLISSAEKILFQCKANTILTSQRMVIFSVEETLGPVVQSIVRLTSSLRGQRVKCFTTSVPNTQIFFVAKKVRSFCTAKASHIFSTKNIDIFEILTF